MSRVKKAEATNEPEAIGTAVAEVLSNVQQSHDDAIDFDPAKLEAQAPMGEPGDDTDEVQQPVTAASQGSSTSRHLTEGQAHYRPISRPKRTKSKVAKKRTAR